MLKLEGHPTVEPQVHRRKFKEDFSGLVSQRHPVLQNALLAFVREASEQEALSKAAAHFSVLFGLLTTKVLF